MQEPQEPTPPSESPEPTPEPTSQSPHPRSQTWRWLSGSGVVLLVVGALLAALTANSSSPAATTTPAATPPAAQQSATPTTPGTENGDAPGTSSAGSAPGTSSTTHTSSTPATTTTTSSTPTTSGPTPPSWVATEQAGAKTWTSGPCAGSGLTVHHPGTNTTCQFALDVRTAYLKNPTAGQYRVYADVPKFDVHQYFTMYCNRSGTNVVCWSTVHPKPSENAIIWFADTSS